MKRKRNYVQRARQEKTEETRRRIVDALVALHQEIGPNRTTVAAVAEKAGVQRLTVYRHFPDEAALLSACSQHYAAMNPPPDPKGWDASLPRNTYLVAALTDVYTYFNRTAPMLERVSRDAPDNPILKEIVDTFGGYFENLASLLAGRFPESERLQATLRHALQFSTWLSLDRSNLADAEKAQLVATWIQACES